MCRRNLVAVLATFITAQLLAAPQLKPLANTFQSLVGTTWTGNSFEKQTMVFEFASDGRVTVTYNGGPIADAGWTQAGDKIYFQLNKRYCEFDGKLIGDRIVGQCYNVAGARWDVTLTPVVREK
jgi:hypothetical protein